MRLTDNRYASEMAKFRLAIRMIGHEARTGTIRSCTGFSEDRIRKIYATYFKNETGNAVRRRRGKTPTQVAGFLASSTQQSEATVLASLFVSCDLVVISSKDGSASEAATEGIERGRRFCEAYETYKAMVVQPELCFERGWSLYRALVIERELYFACCLPCGSRYVQDRYALDYRQCPFCELKAQE